MARRRRQTDSDEETLSPRDSEEAPKWERMDESTGGGSDDEEEMDVSGPRRRRRRSSSVARRASGGKGGKGKASAAVDDSGYEDEDASMEEEEECGSDDDEPSPSPRKPRKRLVKAGGGGGGKGKGKGKQAKATPPTESESDDSETEVAEEEEEEEMEVDEEGEEGEEISEVFASYKPKKLRIGNPHPGKIVETSVLSRATPPDVWYELHPGMERAVDEGLLSSAQLESIIYASQQHERVEVNGGEVGGFFVGDGAGVGKGRTIAGLILENYLRGRKKSMWFSASNDLYEDAKRDLRDIGAGRIPTILLKDAGGYDKRVLASHKGIVYATYSIAIRSQKGKDGKSRVEQLIEWATDGGKTEFNGPLIFDEGHKAKKLVPEKEVGKGKRGGNKSSQTALSVQDLQAKLPKARVCYVSATGASSIENLGYMTRLGLWGRDNGTLFEDQNEFMQASGFKRSTGALELIAMGLKTSGKYLARTLSFADTTFRIERVPVVEEFTMTYDNCVEIWYEVYEIMSVAKDDLCRGTANYSTPMPIMDMEKFLKQFPSQYWGAHLRFFRHICVASKVNFVVELAKKAIEEGKCVVIGLQSTGEAVAQRSLKTATYGQPFRDNPEDDATAELSAAGRPKRRTQTKIMTYAEVATDDDDSDDGGGASSSRRRKPKAAARTPPARRRKGSPSSSAGAGGDDSEEEFVPDGAAEIEEDAGDDASVGAESVASSVARASSRRKAAEDDENDDDDASDDEDGDGGEGVGVQASLVSLVKKYMPDTGVGVDPKTGQPFNYGERKKALITKIRAQNLPRFPLDDLMHQLGGTDKVAEITGRKERVEFDRDGKPFLVNRAKALGVTQKRVNLEEMAAFQKGKKLVAIISEAGSTGISLHADRRAGNKRRRVHITVEIPFNSSAFVQQLGRTHRSNQVTGPEYIAAITDLPGEIRFASTAAKRLAQLGAIAQGDRMACIGSSDLQDFNFENRWGTSALGQFFSFVTSRTEIGDAMLPPSVVAAENKDEEKEKFLELLRQNLTLVNLAKLQQKTQSAGQGAGRGRRRARSDANGDEEEDAVQTKIKAGAHVTQFFNRLLALSVEAQRVVFEFFERIYANVLLDAKARGSHDTGVLTLYANRVLGAEPRQLLRINGMPLVLHAIKWDRGMQWEAALAMRDEHLAKHYDAIREAHAGLGPNPIPVEQRLEGEALERFIAEEQAEDDREGTSTGFFTYDGGQHAGRTTRKDVILALELRQGAFSTYARRRQHSAGARFAKRYRIIFPNSGLKGSGKQLHSDIIWKGEDLHRAWTKVKGTDGRGIAQAKKTWDHMYTETSTNCAHIARGEGARTVVDSKGELKQLVGPHECWLNPNNFNYRSFCPIGRRIGESFLLAGAVIPVWPLLQMAINGGGESNHIQVVRCEVPSAIPGEPPLKLVGLDLGNHARREKVLEAIDDFKHNNPSITGGEDEGLDLELHHLKTATVKALPPPPPPPPKPEAEAGDPATQPPAAKKAKKTKTKTKKPRARGGARSWQAAVALARQMQAQLGAQATAQLAALVQNFPQPAPLQQQEAAAEASADEEDGEEEEQENRPAAAAAAAAAPQQQPVIEISSEDEK